jgi:hypothetical protein
LKAEGEVVNVGNAEEVTILELARGKFRKQQNLGQP